MPRRALSVCFLCLLATAGCGGNSGTSPTPTAPPAPTTFALSGRVTSASTSGQIQGATITVVDGPSIGSTTSTDSSGSYSFAQLLQAGFTVTASASGYTSQSKGVTLTSNQTLSFELVGAKTLITSGTYAATAGFGRGVTFATFVPGQLETRVSWGRRTNLITVELALAANCTGPQYTAGTCQFLFSDTRPSLTEKTATIPSLAAGSYVLWIGDLGPADDTVTYEIYLTP